MTKILLDTANLEEIKLALEYYKIDGITTNPSILSKIDNVEIALVELKNIIKDNDLEIHIQTTETKANKTFLEAQKLRDFFGEKFFIKIPANKEGVLAMKYCKKQGIKITATAVFTQLQALLCAKIGADYVAPYINRLESQLTDSKLIIGDINDFIKNYSTEILAASFKNQRQLLDIVLLGVGAVTLTPELLNKCIENYNTEIAIEKFLYDWFKKFDKTLGNLVDQ